MSHPAQREFCERVKARFPEYFTGVTVLDCGSLDVNGTNRPLFSDARYTGVDLGAGPNVDLVSAIHELTLADGTFDVIVSTECFEHDRYYAESLRNMVRMLRPGGLLFFTCATTGRAEHGTRRAFPESSPLTSVRPDWTDYYRNLTEQDVREAIALGAFARYEFALNTVDNDLYFWGVKADPSGDGVRRPSAAMTGELRCGIVTCQPVLASQAAEIAKRNANGPIGLMGFFNGCAPSPDFDMAIGAAENVGQVKGLHGLWQAWSGPHHQDDLLAFIHDDVHILERGWDEQVRKVMQDSDVLLVGFGGAERVTLAPGHVQRFEFVSNMVHAESYGKRIQKAQRVAVLDSFAMIARMSFLDELKGLDWWPYPYHCIDYALSLEVMKRNKQTWVVPVRCEHLDGRTARTALYTNLAAQYGGPDAVLKNGTQKLFDDYAKYVQVPKKRSIHDYMYRR